MEKVVVALGGNALQDGDSDTTAETQLKIIERTMKCLVDLIKEGYDLIITHGNGPQVGRIVIQNEIANKVTPAMPLDVCGAMSQGMIGYHMQQTLRYELATRGIKKPVVTIITQVVVDKEDQAFKKVAKPIGPFYTKEEAKVLKKEKGYNIIEDSGRGYRRVVASPQPKRIVEIETIKTLIDNNNIVITVGGGGIPVIEEKGKIRGVEAVIDKDLASEILAEDIDADTLIILTAVEKVAINFGKPNQNELDEVTVDEMKKYVAEGHFAPGSMLPKVLAGIKFTESKPGRKTIITSLDKAKEGLEGLRGTIIVN
ncbi:carbamate kinase [Schnuerera sp. xch1]|uniref:carbamate kinase n=1 Tax=Schnuerera sp. xch1 TaxID=2874283 RepID=UPI001CBCB33F|nr:carbamate kinase [Schnuerera sp. xch1]MBZ2175190.1 carbamate kinase [Schnuerera sp. xch1]